MKREEKLEKILQLDKSKECMLKYLYYKEKKALKLFRIS